MDRSTLPAEAIRASARNVVPAERFLDGALSEEEIRSSGWRLQSTGDAAWALAKYREAEALAAGIRAQAAEWRNEVDTWERSALEPLTRTVDFFGEHLRRYALTQREETGTKTVALPGGRIETRATTRPRVVVDDAATFTDWVQANQPDAIKTTVEAKVSLLTYDVRREDGALWGKLIVPGTGEIIPGVHAEWSETTAEVKV